MSFRMIFLYWRTPRRGLWISTGLLLVLLHASIFTEARTRYWQLSDYEKTNIYNYKKNSLLKRVIDFAHIDYAALHAALFFETNARRKKHGRKLLEHHPLLEKAAFGHSRDMVKQNFFSHINPNTKSSPQERARAAGIPKPALAENIASNFGLRYKAGKSVYNRGKGQFSYSPSGPLIESRTYLELAEAFLDQWMGSSGHRKNILSPNALQLGCGAYFYRNNAFNDMPMFKATQNFQLYKPIPDLAKERH